MRLNTRATGPEVENTQILDWRNPQTLQDSSFDPKKPTFIFVHGFLGHIDKDWLIELMKVKDTGVRSVVLGSIPPPKKIL